MTNVIIVVGVVVVAACAAFVGRRRTPEAPTQPRMQVPTQIDRSDFAESDKPWLVAVFSSASCHTCADVVAKAKALATSEVAVHDVEYGTAKDLHRRYDIDAVPTVVIADADGVVQASFLGPVTATDLWAAVAECREPGSRPNAHCQDHEGD